MFTCICVSANIVARYAVVYVSFFLARQLAGSKVHRATYYKRIDNCNWYKIERVQTVDPYPAILQKRRLAIERRGGVSIRNLII